MITQEQIVFVILYSQRGYFFLKEVGFIRENIDKVTEVVNFATIITGLRRCGKSALLLQLAKQKHQDALYFNLEDIRLDGFETNDFKR